MENKALLCDVDGQPLDFNSNDFYTRFVRIDCILCVNPAVGYALEKLEPEISNDSNRFFVAYIAACKPHDLPLELTESGGKVAADYVKTFTSTEYGKYNFMDYFNFVRENLSNYGDTVIIGGNEYCFEFPADNTIIAVPDNYSGDCDEITYTPDEFINLIFELI